MSWRATRASARLEPASRRVAIIDLGSNSWRLAVFSYAPDAWWKQTDELYETVRIGAGLEASGRLSEVAMERGLETLDIFSRFCRAAGLAASDIYPVATSAIRDATNRSEFLARAEKETGLQVRVLSEREEGFYGYVAAVNTSTLQDGMVLELGGGSMQLVQVGRRRARAIESFPLGAVRLTESLLAGERPAKRKELQRVRDRVAAALREVAWTSEGGPRLVGLGGAVRNLAAAAQSLAGDEDLGVQGYRIGREVIDELTERLAALSPQERGSLPGIKPGRGDIILAASLTLQTVMEHGSFPELEVTEAGLREGVFLAETLLAGGEPLFDDVRRSAVRNLAVQYEADMAHVEHVARLALEMHDSLAASGLFVPAPDERELLWAAAMLHDVGMTISYDDHHKHSRYLIVTAELPGFDPRERALIAQVSRYHRKGTPKLGELASLTREGDEELLGRCAMILRLAEHLERGRDQSVQHVRLSGDGSKGDDSALRLEASGDLTLPRWSVERYCDEEDFERVFGRRLVIG